MKENTFHLIIRSIIFLGVAAILFGILTFLIPDLGNALFPPDPSCGLACFNRLAGALDIFVPGVILCLIAIVLDAIWGRRRHD